MAPQGGVFITADHEQHLLKGALYTHIVPLIDGRRTVAQLQDALSGAVTAAEVSFVVQALSRRGLVVEAAESSPQRAMWHELGTSPDDAHARIKAASVAVCGMGTGVDPVVFSDALLAEGIEVALVPEGASLLLVVTDDYLDPALAVRNADALRTGQPWVLVRPMGRAVWLGPQFRPDETACWECMAHALRLNRPVERYLGTGQRPARAATAGSQAAAAGLAAHQIASMLAGVTSLAALVTLDLKTLATQKHAVRRRPQCRVCGAPHLVRAAQEQPIELRESPTRYRADGGHRVQRPAETVARLSPLISPLTGAIRLLEPLEHEGFDVMPVYDSGPNLARTSQNLFFLKQAFRSRSGGKGKTDGQARASALCEAIERYCCVYHGDEAITRATASKRGRGVLLPQDLLHFSEAQYRGRQAHNQTTQKPSQQIPEPFDPRAKVDWQAAWSLTHQRRRWLPAALCYYGFPIEEGPRFGWADSNGSAAGNTREEAIVQGFCELVERDCVAVWWYNRIQRPAVDLGSFDEPWLSRVVQQQAAIGRQVWALDLTHDLGMPAFAALSRRSGAGSEQIAVGFGAHLDPDIALSRAMTEMGQFMPYLGDGLAELPIADAELIEWLTTARLAENQHLRPSDAPPTRREGIADLSTGDLAEDVQRCVAMARDAGLETVVVDLTRPDIGLPVVRVVVPGLRHFWARSGPGRLYEVPVALGWLAEPTREAWLNPIPVFF